MLTGEERRIDGSIVAYFERIIGDTDLLFSNNGGKILSKIYRAIQKW